MSEESADAFLLRHTAAGDRRSNEMGAAEPGGCGNWPTPDAGGNDHARPLSGGQGSEVRSPFRSAGANKIRQCHHLLQHEDRRRYGGIEAQEAARRGGFALKPYAT